MIHIFGSLTISLVLIAIASPIFAGDNPEEKMWKEVIFASMERSTIALKQAVPGL